MNVTTDPFGQEAGRVQSVENADDMTKMADEGSMSPLHPDQIKVLRIRTAIVATVLLSLAAVIDFGPLRDAPVRAGLATSVVAILCLAALVLLPVRRYRAWAWREDEEELHVRHGLVVRTHTIVPFGRVQHIDVAQGPIERSVDLSTLILHTAGTRGASVPLPGLKRENAEAMRDRIRARIRQDLL